MVRENSFSDSDGRSLTPDLSEEDHDFIGTSPITTNDPSSFVQGSSQQPKVIPSMSVRPPTPGTATSETVRSPAAISGLPPPSSPIEDAAANPVSNLNNFSQVASAPTVPTRSNTAQSIPVRPGHGSARFRSSVQKIIHMNRGYSALSRVSAGAEPGIDPRRSSAYLNYGHIREKCTIDIVDYSSVRVNFRRMDNREFTEYLVDPTACRRESWVKVRWINIGGVSWDVISTLAIKYDIHPLALEDVMHQRGNQARSKADYYIKHLFIRILRHTLGSDDSEAGATTETIAPLITRLPRSSSPVMMEHGEENEGGEKDDDKTLAGSRITPKKPVGSMRKAQAIPDLEQGRQDDSGWSRSLSSLRLRHKREAETMTIEQLKRRDRVNVDTIPLFIFLFRDGTVISINQSPDVSFTAPISARLRQRDTGLRATADPSLLVQSLLDLTVDQALEVVEEYQQKILKLEHDVLIKPKMRTVRSLHIMSGDLTLHKRTLDPIKTLVYGLRRYDIDRCAALVNSDDVNGKTKKIEGFMSHKSKIYLADVYDHIDYILNSMDMFSSISENLINYTFNMASYEMNEVMRRLTLVTIICLPLTLLTGYFGMNFQPFWAINNNSDLFFWELAIPILLVIIPAFTLPDIRRLIHYAQKKWAARKVEKAYKKFGTAGRN